MKSRSFTEIFRPSDFVFSLINHCILHRDVHPVNTRNTPEGFCWDRCIYVVHILGLTDWLSLLYEGQNYDYIIDVSHAQIFHG